VVAALWGRFPDRVAVQWNLSGPVKWADKFPGLLVCPALSVALALVFGWIPRLDPRLRREPEANERSNAAIGVIRLATTALVSFGALLIAAEALGHHVNSLRLGINLVLLFFVVLGNYIGTVRPNYFVGIRTPWTLESDDVWRATHRNCGRILVFGSLAFLVLQLLVEQAYMLPCYFGFVAATGLWSVLYSYWRFRSSHPPGPTPGRHSD